MLKVVGARYFANVLFCLLYTSFFHHFTFNGIFSHGITGSQEIIMFSIWGNCQIILLSDCAI